MWVLGANFVEDTARTNYKFQDPEGSYTTRNYNVEVLASTEHRSNNPSTLARIRNTLTHGLNKCTILPQLVLIVLEDDVIKEINVKDDYMLRDFTRRVKWLMSEFRKTIDAAKDALQPNAKTLNQPKFIWVLPTKHKNYRNSYPRRKFSQAIETQCKLNENMIALRLVQRWDYEDSNLFLQEEQRFTSEGKAEFWRAVDKTVEFFDKKYTDKREVTPSENNNRHGSGRDQMRNSSDNRPTGSQRYEERRFRLPNPYSRR